MNNFHRVSCGSVNSLLPARDADNENSGRGLSVPRTSAIIFLSLISEAFFFHRVVIWHVVCTSLNRKLKQIKFSDVQHVTQGFCFRKAFSAVLLLAFCTSIILSQIKQYLKQEQNVEDHTVKKRDIALCCEHWGSFKIWICKNFDNKILDSFFSVISNKHLSYFLWYLIDCRIYQLFEEIESRELTSHGKCVARNPLGSSLHPLSCWRHQTTTTDILFCLSVNAEVLINVWNSQRAYMLLVNFKWRKRTCWHHRLNSALVCFVHCLSSGV